MLFDLRAPILPRWNADTMARSFKCHDCERADLTTSLAKLFLFLFHSQSYNQGQTQLRHSSKKTCFFKHMIFSVSNFHISKGVWLLSKNMFFFGIREGRRNLVPRLSLLCLPWSLEERPWLRLVTLPPRIWVAKKICWVGGVAECFVWLM